LIFGKNLQQERNLFKLRSQAANTYILGATIILPKLAPSLGKKKLFSSNPSIAEAAEPQISRSALLPHP